MDRLLSIVITLLNQDKITAQELARTHEVSVRTIYRDLDAIQAAGVPLAAYPGNQGGFGIMENYRLERQLLTLSDMAAMLTALKGIQTSLPAVEMTSAIQKIGSLVPRAHRQVINDYHERIAVDMTGWYFDEKRRSILTQLYTAVVENRLISFTYRNLKGEEGERTVEPMTLLFKGSSWYLFAFCRKKKNFRLFHIGRMNSVSPPASVFTRRPVSYADFFKEEKDPQGAVELVLRFPVRLRIKVEDFFPPEHIDEREGFLYARTRLKEDEWVYGMILSYGADCEVVSPSSIRNRIISILKNLNNVYQT